MNVTKTVAGIRKLQERYVATQDEIKERIKSLDKEVNRIVGERLAAEFPDADFYYLTSFHCSSLTDKWRPQVFLYRVNNLHYTGSYWCQGFAADDRVPPPVPTRRLLGFLKDLSEEVGVKVTLVRQKPYTSGDDMDIDFDKIEDRRPLTVEESEIQYC